MGHFCVAAAASSKERMEIDQKYYLNDDFLVQIFCTVYVRDVHLVLNKRKK